VHVAEEPQKPRIAVLQMADRTYIEWFEDCVKTVQNYCNKHGYDYILQKEPLQEDCYTSYQKPLFLLKYIQDYDYVMWIDSDAIIANDNIKLEDKISEHVDRWIFYTEDPASWPLNSGVLIFKNCEQSIDLLNKWWDIRRPNKNHPWRLDNAADQGRLISILGGETDLDRWKEEAFINDPLFCANLDDQVFSILWDICQQIQMRTSNIF
jgi:hypothetical protein